uniref:Uncharacterized protein n=1 Tax=Arundo donax TaxID=35708 RepID=A0A0A9C672_ARUDO
MVSSLSGLSQSGRWLKKLVFLGKPHKVNIHLRTLR